MIWGTSEVLQYFYASCILFVPVFCGLERTCPPHVKLQGRRGVCGSQLTNLISMACMFGGYNTGHKRSVDQTKHLKPDSIPMMSEANSNNNNKVNGSRPAILEEFRAKLKQQMISKRQAASFLVKKSAYDEQGVVCECCYFQCNFREIQDYCSDDDDGFFKRSLRVAGTGTSLKGGDLEGAILKGGAPKGDNFNGGNNIKSVEDDNYHKDHSSNSDIQDEIIPSDAH